MFGERPGSSSLANQILAPRKSRGHCRGFVLNLECGMPDWLLVLVMSDALAHVVGFPVQLTLILLGQVTAVGGHVFFLVVLEALLAALQARCLSRCQLAVLDPVGNPVLLVLLPLIDLVHPRRSPIHDSRSGARGVAAVAG